MANFAGDLTSLGGVLDCAASEADRLAHENRIPKERILDMASKGMTKGSKVIKKGMTPEAVAEALKAAGIDPKDLASLTGTKESGISRAQRETKPSQREAVSVREDLVKSKSGKNKVMHLFFVDEEGEAAVPPEKVRQAMINCGISYSFRGGFNYCPPVLWRVLGDTILTSPDKILEAAESQDEIWGKSE